MLVTLTHPIANFTGVVTVAADDNEGVLPFTNGRASIDLDPDLFGAVQATGITIVIGAQGPAPAYDANLDVSTAAIVTAAASTTTTALRAAYAAVGNTRRDILRAVPQMPLHPTPPTVTLSAVSAATGLSGSTVDVGFADTRFRFTGCRGTYHTAPWFVLGNSPMGSTLDQGAPYFIDFIEDTADFEILLAGNVASRSYRLWVDGQPLTASNQTGPGATGGTHRLRLAFASRATRHIRILTNAGFVGITHLTVDTLALAQIPLYSKVAYILGDSFTAGAGATQQQDSYVYTLCDRLGWEPLNGGELGTGYLTPQGSGGRDTFANRATNDVVPVHPDVVIVYGGTNDVATGLQDAAAATFAALAAGLPKVPVYVFGCQYPSGAADSTRDTKDAAIAAAAAAAPNVVAYRSVKSWITGTGHAGATAGDGNADIFTSSDALHPTTAGHFYLATRMFQEIAPVYAPLT